MEHKVKVLQETKKTIFNELTTDAKSVLSLRDELNTKLLKKLKKSPFTKDNKIKKINDDKVPIRLDYVEKREIDRSTVYSFDFPFQLLHADVGNLEFLGKLASVPNYALLIVDLYSSKVCYVYPMRSTKQIHKKLEQF